MAAPAIAIIVALGYMAPLPAFGFTLTWRDNSTNETGFEIERQVGSGTMARAAQVSANVTQWRDTTADVSQLTCYRIRAYLTANNQTYYSDYSNTACGIHIPKPDQAVVTVSVP